jgi:hypothetical protein
MKRTPRTLIALAASLTVAACAHRGSAVVPAPVAAPVEVTPVVLAAANAPVAAPEAATPTTLPSGHPSIEPILAGRKAQADQAAPAPAPAPSAAPQLPSGHPDISKMQGGAGAGAGPGAMNGGKLPAGHPDINQLRAAAQKPTTQQSLIGSLSVKAVQGTANAPAIAAAPVTIEFYQGEQLFDKVETKLDANGVASLKDVALAVGVQPVAKVNYNGVAYQIVGEQMDAQHPDQKLEVKVYETTDQQPAWQIHMQHIIVQPTTEGVQVMEMMAIENPTDRAWVGKAGADNKRTTITFSLPKGAQNIQFAGGNADSEAKVENDQVVESAPLQPGTSQYRVIYTVPVTNGSSQFAFSAPAPVKNLMMFVPDDGTTVKVDGLVAGGVANMGNGKTRFFKGADLRQGAEVKISLSGITAATSQAAATAETATASATDESGAEGSAAAATPAVNPMSAQLAKAVVGAGGLVIFVVGGFFLFVKSPKAQPKRARA